MVQMLRQASTGLFRRKERKVFNPPSLKGIEVIGAVSNNQVEFMLFGYLYD